MSFFKNKTVWITGASSGIGEALAYEFSRQGAKVVLSARRASELERVAAACPGPATIHPLDLADHDSLPIVVQQVLADVGRVDVLVNNAGLSQRSLAKDTDFAVDKRLIDVNLLGTIALSKALLPHFLENKNGHYVTVTSLMGKFGGPLRSSYAAAKHGLHGFFESLRAEVWRDGVLVTMICPGFVQTNVSKNALTGDGSAQGSMDEATAKGLLPDDLAKKILRAIRQGREEACFGGFEVVGVYVRRYFPWLFYRMIRRAKVT